MIVTRTSLSRTAPVAALARPAMPALFVMLVLGASSPAQAQSMDPTGATDAQAPAVGTDAQGAHPTGIADRAGEAPGSTGLVALPGESLPRAEQRANGSDPASDRAMAFSAGGGQCRDTIPGGPILAAAYACILALLGLYAFALGRKNAKLSAQLDELERLVSRAAAREAPSGSEP
jgi:CcmD family protein